MSDAGAVQKAALKALVGKYHSQITRGCGRQPCSSQFCASNPAYVQPATPTLALRAALDLIKNKVPLCEESTADLPLPSTPFTPAPTRDSIVPAAPMASPSNAHVGLTTSIATPSTTTAASTSSAAASSTPASSLISMALSFNTPATAATTGSSTSTADYSPMIVSSTSAASPAPLSVSQPVSAPQLVLSPTAVTSIASISSPLVATTSVVAVPATAPLQFDDVRALIDECGQAGDFTVAKHRLSAVFGDANLLDQSFLSKSAEGAVVEATAQSPQIDYAEFEEICGLIEACDLQDAVMGALSRLSTHHSFTSPSGTMTPARLRKYVWMLVLPWWDCERSVPRIAMGNLYNYLGGTSHEPRETLIQWLSNTSESQRLPALLTQLHDFIDALFDHGTRDQRQRHVIHAVQSMAIVFAANNRTRVITEISDFYNDNINRPCFSLRDDYRRFLNNSNRSFSFCQHAFVLSPATKARILEVDAAYQMNRAIDHVILQAMLAGQNEVSPYLVLEVSRQNLIADTLMHLQLIDSRDLKKKLRIKFIGEDGIDAGGVQREFFAIIIRDLFNAQYGMFQPVAQSHCVWFNSNAMEECQPEYELIGKLLGLAIFNNVLLDIRFPQVVYKKLLRQPIALDDLKSLDPEMWRGFKQLLDFDGDVAEVYDRTFTVEKQSAFGGDVEIVELKAGGAQIALTRENRAEYVRLYVDWILNRSVSQQYRPFEEGFWEVAGGDALRLFAATELELVICGSPDIDFHAMEDVAVYEEPLSPDHRLVTDFWRAVHSLEGTQKGKFLLFCTGSDRVPIQGLGTLKLTISLAGGGPDRLMSSHTCFNHVLLPPYATYESLRDRMLQSIENCEGFGLV